MCVFGMNYSQLIENVLNEGIVLSGQYLQTQSNIQESAKQIGIYDTTQWCPANPASNVAVNIRDQTYQVGIQLRDTALKAESEVKGIESDLHGMVKKANDVDDALNEIGTYMTIAKVLVVFIDIIVLLLMITCTLAWLDKLELIPVLMGNSFIIPTFVVLLIVFWCFTTLSLIGAMAGSDYCTAPDENMVNILADHQSKFSPLMFLMIMYYITVSCMIYDQYQSCIGVSEYHCLFACHQGCLSDRQPLKLEDLSAALSKVGETVHGITEQVTGLLKGSNLAEQCGADGPTKLLDLLGLADTKVHSIFGALSGVKGLLVCENTNPIYTTFAYDGEFSFVSFNLYSYVLVYFC